MRLQQLAPPRPRHVGEVLQQLVQAAKLGQRAAAVFGPIPGTPGTLWAKGNLADRQLLHREISQ